jgi:hypothetical protein
MPVPVHEKEFATMSDEIQAHEVQAQDIDARLEAARGRLDQLGRYL